jgi:hypothetical protein
MIKIITIDREYGARMTGWDRPAVKEREERRDTPTTGSSWRSWAAASKAH